MERSTLNQSHLATESVEAVTLRPAIFPFWRGVIIFSLFWISLFLVVIYNLGGFTLAQDKSVIQIFLFIGPISSIVCASLVHYLSRWERSWKRWEYDESGVRIIFHGQLKVHIDWTDIRKVTYGKQTMAIWVKEAWWMFYAIKYILKPEYSKFRDYWLAQSDKKIEQTAAEQPATRLQSKSK